MALRWCSGVLTDLEGTNPALDNCREGVLKLVLEREAQMTLYDKLVCTLALPLASALTMVVTLL